MAENYYTSGEFAKKANVTLRTIRYYDKQNILTPSFRSEGGVRHYTDADFVKLQQILLLKYLGFSLQDIREMTIAGADPTRLEGNLKIQKKLLQERISQMQLMMNAIDDATEELDKDHEINWDQMMHLIHMSNEENSLKTQYQNTANIAARIHLHEKYSTNQQGWFPWVFAQCRIRQGMRILEIGCGDGTLWLENRNRMPELLKVTLSDVSAGMVRDVRRTINAEWKRTENEEEDENPFAFRTFDCKKIPFPAESFDLVIANHVLFYCDNIPKVLHEISRVLVPGGRLIAATYGRNHMKEVTDLVQEFDSRIVLSTGEKLYERFGLDDGDRLLSEVFPTCELQRYDDSIEINDSQPLIEYILSCHGNQNQYLMERYTEFRHFTEEKLQKTFHITKDAGAFICTK